MSNPKQPTAGEQVAAINLLTSFVSLAVVDKVTPSGQLVIGSRRFKLSRRSSAEGITAFDEIGGNGRLHYPVSPDHLATIARQKQVIQARKNAEIVASTAVGKMTESELALLEQLATAIKERRANGH